MNSSKRGDFELNIKFADSNYKKLFKEDEYNFEIPRKLRSTKIGEIQVWKQFAKILEILTFSICQPAFHRQLLKH